MGWGAGGCTQISKLLPIAWTTNAARSRGLHTVAPRPEPVSLGKAAHYIDMHCESLSLVSLLSLVLQNSTLIRSYEEASVLIRSYEEASVLTRT